MSIVLKPVFFDKESIGGLVDVVMSAHGRALQSSRGLNETAYDSINRVEGAVSSICSFHPERFSCLEEQACALACRLAKDHCFPDGNKRTAIVVAIAYMETYGRAVQCTTDRFVRAALCASKDDADGVRRALLG